MITRKTYSKPQVAPLRAITNSKVGLSRSRQKIRSSIEGVPVRELVESYGSPLYVFSENRIRNKVAQLHNAFASRYPNVELAWSYKTNYLNAICSVFHASGCKAEVVSEMEYHKARKLGVDGSDIYFNGPLKSMDVLQLAATEGAHIHIDHFDELDDLTRLSLSDTLKVGLRLNLDAGIVPQWSRFGFNLENGEALQAAERIAASGNLSLSGIHCHIGTYITDPSAYANQIRKMVEFMKEVERRWGFHIDYLDIGGGLPSKSRLKGATVSPRVALADIEEYAEETTSAFLETLPAGRQPKLVLESGRFLIDEAGFLLTSVVARKSGIDGRKCYIVDTGTHNLLTGFWYRFNIETEKAYSSVPSPSTIYGSLCMNIDVVEEDIQLPQLERGAILTISPVGAYNNTQSMQFIHTRPATVLIRENSVVELIREPETLDDIIRRERNPLE